MSQSTDVVIIGGGPAGATVGAILAQHGRSVRLFEREAGPRFHIGESLIPMTYWTLRRIGMLPRLQASNFPLKYSVQFVTHDGKESQPFYFFDTNPHESSVTWQVWRQDFDQMLLDNAAEQGCRVEQGVTVTDVLFDGDRARGVTVRRGDGSSETIPAKVVVDASGQSAVIPRRRQLLVPNPHLKQASVWTYWKNVRLGEGIDRGATLVLNTSGKKGWFWVIPLANDITSVGVVSNRDYLLAGQRPLEEIYQEQVQQCPNLQERLARAERVKDYYVTKDFSYVSQVGAGDGWVSVGDAFGFLDPIYSTGVFLAFRSGEKAADAIDAALHAGDVSAARLAGWQSEHFEAIDLFRKLVYAFYSYQFSFGQFIRQYPRFYRNLVDMLVGNVFRPGIGDIFAVMGEKIPYDGQPPRRQAM